MRDTEYAQVNTRQLHMLVELTTTAHGRARNEFGVEDEITQNLHEAAHSLERAHDLLVVVECESE
jgi:hypothetical protein